MIGLHRVSTCSVDSGVKLSTTGTVVRHADPWQLRVQQVHLGVSTAVGTLLCRQFFTHIELSVFWICGRQRQSAKAGVFLTLQRSDSLSLHTELPTLSITCSPLHPALCQTTVVRINNLFDCCCSSISPFDVARIRVLPFAYFSYSPIAILSALCKLSPGRNVAILREVCLQVRVPQRFTYSESAINPAITFLGTRGLDGQAGGRM